MENSKIKPADVYITYDYNRQVQHIKCSDRGTTGFLDFMRVDMTFIRQLGLGSNLWLTHYSFDDRRFIPSIERKDMSEYLVDIALAAERHGGVCVHTINMDDAFYCFSHGIAPLTPSSQVCSLAKNDDYPSPQSGDISSGQSQPNVFLPEYRAYEGLETSSGILLFSISEEGARQRETYEKFLENNFFTSSSPHGTLNYYEVIAEPSKINKWVDRLGSESAAKQIDKAYADNDILAQSNLKRSFDLERTMENYNAFCRRNDTQARQRSMSRLSFNELWGRISGFGHGGKNESLQCVENKILQDSRNELTYKTRL